MSRLPILRALLLAAPLVMASGCTSLGSNVKGSFACRAPDGTCAPTSTIDAGATGIDRAEVRHAHRPLPTTGEAVRRLQVVLAGYRDEAGREHEARVVHLTLPEPVGTGWRAPQGRRDILRSLGATIAATREGNPAPDSRPTEHHTNTKIAGTAVYPLAARSGDARRRRAGTRGTWLVFPSPRAGPPP